MRSIGLLCVATAVGVSLAATLAGQQPSTQDIKSRAMHRQGRPLEEILTPGAGALTVEKDQFPPMIVEPVSGTGELEWLTRFAATVVILDVQTVVSRLSPARDWIDSEVRANVEQVLKYAPTVVQGSSIRFHQDGGEMVIRGTRVTAVLEYADGFLPTHRYLVFADATDSDGTLGVQPLVSYLIDNTDRLVPLAHEGKPTSERGVPISAAIGRIKAETSKRH